MTDKTVTFLLVEDDDVDVKAIERSLRELRIKNPLVIARDGREALEHLRGENNREKIVSPFLILLDLNMPRMNGLEFLAELRSDPELSTSVVFVMTTSKDDRDRLSAYEKHVAGYIVKSNVANSFTDAMKFIDHYWRVVEFP
ncbi:response regulator [Denitrobaculum tricleocarpae]|uniref:Response regulator n=1 Tax=Denitrobaculum tricleocarpae TaxID=2591009 RepID=A0A545TTT3_9PROT|nr:response regulator [Denitrobaculum tricleocarpae]TQV80625.1 response regulator [Denitrobaculum tricleocarpae]